MSQATVQQTAAGNVPTKWPASFTVMMRLKNRDKVPPDAPGVLNFRYTHSETRHRSEATNWKQWRERILEHRKGNSLDIPANIMEMAEDQLCRQLSPEWCERSEKDANFVSTRVSLSELWSGVKAHVKSLVYGFVSQEEADRRAHICGGCFLNLNPEGCGACAQLGEFVTGDVAGQKTKYDGELKACVVCKCPNKSIVHFPMALLEESDTPEKQSLYPKEFCWRSKESPNYSP